MGVKHSNRTDRVGRTNLRHLTTVVLEERADGEWLATQTGVAVEGYGETAAEAAANYCRKIDGRDDE